MESRKIPRCEGLETLRHGPAFARRLSRRNPHALLGTRGGNIIETCNVPVTPTDAGTAAVVRATNPTRRRTARAPAIPLLCSAEREASLGPIAARLL